jgi:hypothetical protein
MGEIKRCGCSTADSDDSGFAQQLIKCLDVSHGLGQFVREQPEPIIDPLFVFVR